MYPIDISTTNVFRYDAPATALDGPSPGRAKDGMTSVGTGLVSKKPRTAIFRPPMARRKPGVLKPRGAANAEEYKEVE